MGLYGKEKNIVELIEYVTVLIGVIVGIIGIYYAARAYTAVDVPCFETHSVSLGAKERYMHFLIPREYKGKKRYSTYESITLAMSGGSPEKKNVF